MRYNILLSYGFIFIGFILHAQTDFRPGYVIKENEDTLFGKIDYRGDYLMSKLCKFKPKFSNTIINYYPGDVKEFRFINSKCYVSRTLESGRKVFLEYLIKGKLNVYYYRDEDFNDYYLVDKEGFPLKTIPYREGIRFTEDGTRVYFQSTIHIGLLNAYTQDANDFKLQAEKIKSPDHNNLIKFAKNYHEIICKDENCIIFENDLSIIKTSVEFIYGITIFNQKYSNNLRTNEFGSYIYIWMPRASEKLYFKTGLQFCQLNYEDDNYIFYRFPLQISYQHFYKKIGPKFYLGFNNYFIKPRYFWTIPVGGGVDFKIIEKVTLTSNLTAEFKPIAYSFMEFLDNSNSIDVNPISYSISIGIRIYL